MIHDEARVVAQEPAHLHDGSRVHDTERKVPVDLRFQDSRAELFLQEGRNFFRFHAAPFSVFLASVSFSIFFCTWINPSNKDSGRGGHPGT